MEKGVNMHGKGESKNELCGGGSEKGILACVHGFQQIYVNIEINREGSSSVR